jgi:hypothetical protein
MTELWSIDSYLPRLGKAKIGNRNHTRTHVVEAAGGKMNFKTGHTPAISQSCKRRRQDEKKYKWC